MNEQLKAILLAVGKDLLNAGADDFLIVAWDGIGVARASSLSYEEIRERFDSIGREVKDLEEVEVKIVRAMVIGSDMEEAGGFMAPPAGMNDAN